MALSIKKNSAGKWELKDGSKVVSTHKLQRYAKSAMARHEAAPKRKRGPTRPKAARRQSSTGGLGKTRAGQSHAVQIEDKDGKRIGSVHPHFVKVEEKYTTKKGKEKTRMVQVKMWRARSKKGKLLGKPTKLMRIAKARVLRTKSGKGYRNA